MSDTKNPNVVKTRKTSGEDILQALSKLDANSPSKWTIYTFIVVMILVIVTIGFLTFFYVKSINKLNINHTAEMQEFILGKEDIEMTNSWERLPDQQRREIIRAQHYKIIKYYTESVPEDQKMSNELIEDVFNIWYNATKRLNQDPFISLAYIRVMTNFNPIYNVEYKRGIGGMFLQTYENVANLPIVREDPSLQTIYRGSETANNPTESIKLVVAYIDYLMRIFNNRVDWVMLSLFTNEYDVMKKYWDDGDGAIPSELYQSGDLAKALMYYHSFTNWQIPKQ
jgi:hypothetical protein